MMYDVGINLITIYIKNIISYYEKHNIGLRGVFEIL